MRRHFLPQTWVVTTPQTNATAMIAAWHPKLTPGPVAPIHFNWKYVTQNPAVVLQASVSMEHRGLCSKFHSPPHVDNRRDD